MVLEFLEEQKILKRGNAWLSEAARRKDEKQRDTSHSYVKSKKIFIRKQFIFYFF
jgi:hypothetical protein